MVCIPGINNECIPFHVQPEFIFVYAGEFRDHFHFIADMWTSATGSPAMRDWQAVSSATSYPSRPSPFSRIMILYRSNCGEPTINSRSIREKTRANISFISSNRSRGISLHCCLPRSELVCYFFSSFFSSVSVILLIAVKSFFRAKVSLRSSCTAFSSAFLCPIPALVSSKAALFRISRCSLL
jgi:hypothetical protein